MRRWVTIAKDANIFAKKGPFGMQFVDTGHKLRRGTQVEIGQAMRAYVPGLHYDIAVPFVAADGETRWFLPEPAGIDLDDVPGIEEIWIERFEEMAHYVLKEQAEFFAELRRRNKAEKTQPKKGSACRKTS